MDDKGLKLIESLQQAFDRLASQLGVVAPKVWEILIRQQYVEALQAIPVLFAILVVWVLYYKTVFPSLGDYTWKHPDDRQGAKVMSYFMLVVLVLFGSVFGIFWFNDAIGKWANPEYYALKSILKIVAGK